VSRRDFITLLGGAAAAPALMPPAVGAQQLDRVRRIGVIMGFAEDDEVWQAYLATFRRRLQDFGWSEGHNILGRRVNPAERRILGYIQAADLKTAETVAVRA
jgi:hypothetical protein